MKSLVSLDLTQHNLENAELNNVSISKDTPSDPNEGALKYVQSEDAYYHFRNNKWTPIKGVVKNITTDLVRAKDTIPVVGGPLSKLMNEAGITEIPVDTNLQDVLMQMFAKEIYPAIPSFTEGTIKSTIAVPKFNLSVSANAVVEVGQTIDITEVTLPPAASTTVARKLTGFTYGYSASNDDTVDSSNTTIQVSSSETASKNANYEMSRTINGSTVVAIPSPNFLEVRLDATSFNARLGSNTVKVDIKGTNHTCTFAALPEYYICSNFGNTNAGQKTSAHAAINPSSSIPTNSKTISFTGVYPIFATTESIDTFTKAPLQTSKVIELTLANETNTNKQAIKIKGTMTKVEIWNTTANRYDSYNLDRWSVHDEAIDIQGNSVLYNVYTRNDGTNGNQKFKFTFS